MSVRKKKNVQTVEAPKQDTSSAPSAPSAAVVEPQQAEEAPVDHVFEVPKIPAKAIALGKELGFDLGGIDKTLQRLSDWADSVEKRFNMIAQEIPEMPQKTAVFLREMAMKERAKAMEQAQNQSQGQPQQGSGFGVGDILKLVGSGGGQTTNPLQEKFMESMMQKALFGMDLQNAMQTAIIKKIAPELAESLIPQEKKAA